MVIIGRGLYTQTFVHESRRPSCKFSTIAAMRSSLCSSSSRVSYRAVDALADALEGADTFIFAFILALPCLALPCLALSIYSPSAKRGWHSFMNIYYTYESIGRMNSLDGYIDLELI